MRVTLFHNPGAGKKGHGKDEILAALKLADHKVRYVSTKSDKFKSEIEKVEADFIVAAGGDGTIAEIIARLGNRKLPIGILPLGTANNIARSLAIAGEPQILVETWNIERTRRLDIGHIEGPDGTAHFVEAVGIGIVPQMLLKAAKQAKEKGALNLQKGRELLRKITKDAKPLDLDIMVDGKKLDGEWLGAEALNIPYTGPGLPLASKADMTDGMLDLICFEKADRDKLSDWFETPAEGPPPGTTRRGKMISFSWRNAPYRVDDEAHKATDEGQTITLTCDEQPVLVIESPIEVEKKKSEAA
ncbi:MAG TPA: diacylglycerol kinase family protein [Reyranella sp.]|nr:diacylglycerol kinase family protein [Reyranella sp.]